MTAAWVEKMKRLMILDRYEDAIYRTYAFDGEMDTAR